ncbi:ACP S-malonyltransferase [Desulfobacterales bacterium HSG16]|nr:ACP S-malonyltransferase [Desulfobacterales bacterium HSG16]
MHSLSLSQDEILGYSIKELCINDPYKRLAQTDYTQPALYVVNALSWMQYMAETGHSPDFLAGHSLGEYNALFAAGVFDFETGLCLVRKRGRLMARVKGGAMAAIVGSDEGKITDILIGKGLTDVCIANYNCNDQLVISGSKKDIEKAGQAFRKSAGVKLFAPLRVSGAFHSPYMKETAEEFSRFLERFTFDSPRISVISNTTARPYRREDIKTSLSDQITSPVLWIDTIRYLMGQKVAEFTEIGPGKVLAGLIRKIEKQSSPLPKSGEAKTKKSAIGSKNCNPQPRFTASSLGSAGFKNDYGLKYAYVTGAMVKGIASEELVIRMGKAKMMGYFGTGGLGLSRIEDAIRRIRNELDGNEAFGMNLMANIGRPKKEEDIVDLFLKCGVTDIEAAAYMQITPALAMYRLKGLRREDTGKISSAHRVMAKISRPEVAELFLSPAPERIVKKLLDEKRISKEQAQLSRKVSMADHICVEADSGGHTDQGTMTVLLPAMIRLRDRICEKHGYARKVCVGAAGGIGTPEAAAAAFVLGADFILTGSVNQCTAEAGTSDAVKDILQYVEVQDTDYAPAGDMFEMGAKVQVVRKGLFFPARANKLYDLYRQHNSLDEIDEKTKRQIQDRYFKRSFEEVYEETRSYYSRNFPEEIKKAEKNPKQKMALIFKWYFVNGMRLAMKGDEDQKVDYQIHCGPALGAFNQWVKGTELEKWPNRHVDVIGEKLMEETAKLLNRRFETMSDYRLCTGTR